MDLKAAAMVFVAVFVAELGDKTQLATLLFASDKDTSGMMVFLSASLALVLSVGIAVAAGGFVTQYVSEAVLRYIAGSGFIAIGLWTLVSA